MGRAAKGLDDADQQFSRSLGTGLDSVYVRPATIAISVAKAHQSTKLREVGVALMEAGFLTLDAQARALGLSRSTAWTILRGNHKASGLSAAIINRMLSAPELPPIVRATIIDYIDGKTAGLYGHTRAQTRRFSSRIIDSTMIVRRLPYGSQRSRHVSSPPTPSVQSRNDVPRT
jgi:hypothetical protein